jgi:TM2 domain-containing membrane protein YozV
MQFRLMEVDVFFDLHDPRMLAGLVYGCVWVLLSIAFFVAMVSIRKHNGCPFPRQRIVITLVFYAFFGLFLPVVIALSAVNIPVVKGAHVGVIGGPPVWILAMNIVLGIGLGVGLSRWKYSATKISELISRREKNSLNRRDDAVPAVVLGLIFPGMGQAYRGQFITGLGLLLLLVIFLRIGSDLAFLILYLACALGALLWRNDRFW